MLSSFKLLHLGAIMKLESENEMVRIPLKIQNYIYINLRVTIF